MIRISTAFLQILRVVFFLLILLAHEFMINHYPTNSLQQIKNKNLPFLKVNIK